MNESKDPNTQNGRPDDDKALNDEVVSRLYRQLPDESPSADTDALIRAAARREAGAGPQRRMMRLQKGLATAASLVLGVALVVQWQHREPEKLADVLATTPASPSVQAPAALPAPAPEPVATQDAAVPGAAAKPAAPARNQAPHAMAEKTGSAYASGALAGAGSPVQSLAPAPAFAPPEVATAPQEKESLKKSAPESSEEKQADTDRAASRERRLSAAREAAAPAASLAALRQEKAKADVAVAAAATEATATAGLTASYRNAMRQQQWPQALAALEQLPFTTDRSLRIDHDILQQLAGHKEQPACASQNLASLGAQAALCTLLESLAQGKTAPADTFAQLEKAGLLSGEYDYRRPALRQLLQP